MSEMEGKSEKCVTKQNSSIEFGIRKQTFEWVNTKYAVHVFGVVNFYGWFTKLCRVKVWLFYLETRVTPWNRESISRQTKLEKGIFFLTPRDDCLAWVESFSQQSATHTKCTSTWNVSNACNYALCWRCGFEARFCKVEKKAKKNQKNISTFQFTFDEHCQRISNFLAVLLLFGVDWVGSLRSCMRILA